MVPEERGGQLGQSAPLAQGDGARLRLVLLESGIKTRCPRRERYSRDRVEPTRQRALDLRAAPALFECTTARPATDPAHPGSGPSQRQACAVEGSERFPSLVGGTAAARRGDPAVAHRQMLAGGCKGGGVDRIVFFLMGVKELGHVVLYVRDLERSAAFYRDVLGFRQVFGGSQAPFKAAAFSSGRTHHELLLIEVGEDAQPIPEGRRVGMYHFGLKVGDSDDDLREVLSRLRDAGSRVVGFGDHGFTHSIYSLDPDGNEIELYSDVPGVDWSDMSVMARPTRPLEL